jgi:hypothetical protein
MGNTSIQVYNLSLSADRTGTASQTTNRNSYLQANGSWHVLAKNVLTAVPARPPLNDKPQTSLLAVCSGRKLYTENNG